MYVWVGIGWGGTTCAIQLGADRFFKTGLLTEPVLSLFLLFHKKKKKKKKIFTTRKTSSVPDSRSSALYATWTLSTSSVSSQGSISDGDPRQSQPFKSVFVPTAIVNPVRNLAGLGTLGQGSLRKARSSMRKSKWWQRGTCLELGDGGISHWQTECFLQKQGSWLYNKPLWRLLYTSQRLHCFIRWSHTDSRSPPSVTSYTHADWLGWYQPCVPTCNQSMAKVDAGSY